MPRAGSVEKFFQIEFPSKPGVQLPDANFQFGPKLG